jgi:hypothetical protein
MDTTITKEEIISQLEAFSKETYSRDLNHKVEDLKSEYYKRAKETFDSLLNAFIEEGGTREEFEAPVDEKLEAFKALMDNHKQRKEAFNLALEKRYKENKERKKSILAQLKALTEQAAINKEVFDALKEIQDQWNAVKDLKATDDKELWGEYNFLRDVFYSNVKINSELRELDFQKNLEAKKALIEKVNALAAEEDIKKMNDNLQYYHDAWREVGPVKREISEDLWLQFSEVSKVVHKKRQDHYDKIYEQEARNLEAKQALCEQLSAIQIDSVDTVKAWTALTNQLIEIQNEFKTIGFAGKKGNQEVWEKYRSICDQFFNAKSVFFTALKAKESVAKGKNEALIEKVEALKDSEDWGGSTKKIIDIQKQWKQQGDAGKANDFKLWKSFRTACDHFFNRKSEFFEGRKSEETENLKAKEEIIEAMKVFKVSGDKNKDLESLKEFSGNWNAIGHVPFKSKDKVYAIYKKLLDGFFDKLKIADTERMLTEFKSNFGSDGADQTNESLVKEKKRIIHQLNEQKNELKHMEMNMALISKSRGADLFRKEVEKNKTKLEKKVNALQEKIDLFNQLENESKAKAKVEEVVEPRAEVIEEKPTEPRAEGKA